MLTVDYLLEVLPELEEFSDDKIIESQVLAGDGYDEIVAILEDIRTVNFPCVVIEDRSSGNFTIEGGPLDTYTIALWVMMQQTREEETNNSTLFKTAFELMIAIIKLLIRDVELRPTVMGALDITRMAYNKRMGGPKCLGYELLLTFREEIDLSWEE